MVAENVLNLNMKYQRLIDIKKIQQKVFATDFGDYID